MKKLKVLFTVLCVACATTVWGADVTIDKTDLSGMGKSGGGTAINYTESGVTFNCSSAYGNTSYVQLYSGSTLTISSTSTITSIKITCTGSGTANYSPSKIKLGTDSPGSYSYSGTIGTWTGSGNSIIFLLSAQVRMTQVVVTTSGSTETTVSFDSNGGTGSIEAKTGTSGTSITLPDGTAFSKTGCTFVGWNTAKDGSGTFYEPSASFEIPASNTTLYAIWGYTVTWMVGGTEYTEGTPTTSVASGSKVTTLPTAPADNAIGDCADTFVGWSTSELGSTKGQSKPADLFTTAESSPKITVNTTFYAVFATKQTE